VDNKAFLKHDVPTRWNYTYLMLKAAIVYEKVFLKLAEDDTNYVIDLSEARDGIGHPNEDDCDNTKKMAQFLQHFYDLTVCISSSLQITSNTSFHETGEVCLLIQEWLSSEDNLQVLTRNRMKKKFDKYWGLWHTNNKDNEKG
jgi:predicted transcriptional regulator